MNGEFPHNFQKSRNGAAGQSGRQVLQAFGLAVALAGTAVAQTEPVPPGMASSTSPLPDPTRPPPGFVDQVPAGGAGAAASDEAARARARTVTETDPEAGGLQTVLLPRHGKPVAVIGGKYVPLGERYGGYELVAVRESEVVLVRGKERKVLRLTPKAEKRPPQTGASAAQKSPARPGSPAKTFSLKAANAEVAGPSGTESEKRP